ncbi:MAG TPA: HD domain-containing phosphohydrolase [Candidatus Elarobacter sp.]|nr:HD domain-containing phosphohydrolase [Candidatus Elarobacter sp.]
MIGTAMQARAPRIVGTAIGRLRPGARTVGAKVMVARFVDRCADAAGSGDWNGVAAWLDHTCDRYADAFPTHDAIGAALDGVAGALEACGGDAHGVFQRVRGNLWAIATKPRVARDAVAHETVDEVDIVIDGMLTRLDQSDVLTAEHSRAVGSWCGRLAKRLRASKDEALQLTRAGLIHDIGKVMTPNEILVAPRRLDDEEMAIMRRHAEEGERIVLDVPLVTNLAPAVRSHHERFDGAGYPDGLKWEAIPQPARIVAVADAFNAMIGRRPYRPPMPPSRALEQLVMGRGEQFDPDVVDAMIDIVGNRP